MSGKLKSTKKTAVVLVSAVLVTAIALVWYHFKNRINPGQNAGATIEAQIPSSTREYRWLEGEWIDSNNPKIKLGIQFARKPGDRDRFTEQLMTVVRPEKPGRKASQKAPYVCSYKLSGTVMVRKPYQVESKIYLDRKLPGPQFVIVLINSQVEPLKNGKDEKNCQEFVKNQTPQLLRQAFIPAVKKSDVEFSDAWQSLKFIKK